MDNWSAVYTINWFLTGERIYEINPVLYFWYIDLNIKKYGTHEDEIWDDCL